MMSVLKQENIYKWKVLYGYMIIKVKGKEIVDVQVFNTRTDKPFENPYYESRVRQFLPKWMDQMGFKINQSLSE